MKANEILKKILTELSSKKVEFAQQTLDNGTILEAESFESGNEVFIVTDEERIALPVGSYIMADGGELIVEEEGMIASISAAQEEVTEEVAIEAEEEVVVEVPEAVAPAMEEMIQAVVDIVAPMLEEIKEEMTKIKEEMAKYKEKMSSMPAASKIKHNPSKEENNVTKLAQARSNKTIDRVLARLK
jgi:hypothetical protein